jgi:serine protease inhibitor
VNGFTARSVYAIKHRMKLLIRISGSAVIETVLTLLPFMVTSAAPSLSQGNNAFAFSLVRELEKENRGENIFISPYSISTALQMVRAGAGGETKSEMDKVLGNGGSDGKALAKAYKDLDDSIRTSASNAVLNVANAMWYAPNIMLKPDYVSLNTDFYGAKLSALDFTDPRVSGVVNAWVEEATHGKIKKMVEGPMSGLTGAFLCNAIYFKDTWETQFDKKGTQERLFNLPYNQQKTVPMMYQRREFQYQETDTFQAVYLAYSGSHLGMYVFLPKKDADPQKILEQLRTSGWSAELAAKLRGREGTLGMPKFKMEYSAELKKPLMNLGMRRAFSPASADFSGMTSTGLFVDRVKHKSFVEVNEEGTEAAAATGVVMKRLAERPGAGPFQMIVDHPFFFLIEDRPSHTILFLGEVLDPSAS